MGTVIDNNLAFNIDNSLAFLMQELYELRALKKGRQILNDESHVLAQCYMFLPYGRRFRNFKIKTRAQKSFIPCSIKLLNLQSTYAAQF